MKQVTKTTRIFSLMSLLVIGSIISSFTAMPGGEGFEIYLDNKVIMQRFGKELNTVQALQLDSRAANSQLTIKYHHCGKAGKNREIAIRDAQNNILKEWKFADSKDAFSPMSCAVKDIFNLQKGSKSFTLNLYYTSSELPNGRTLASIVLPAKNYTQP